MVVELPEWFEEWAGNKLEWLQSHEWSAEWAYDWYVERVEYWAERHLAEKNADWEDYLATK